MVSRKNQSYEGWSVVVGCFLVLMVFMGIVNNCYSLFIIPVTSSLGFSRSAYSLCQSLVFLFSMLCAAGCWKLFLRFGMLPTMRAACVTLIAAYFLYSYARSLPAFYLLSVVIGLCMGLVTTAPVSLLLNSWFKTNFGFVIGIALMGSGIGGMLFNPVANALLLRCGWQVTYRILAVIMACLAIPSMFILLKEKKTASDTPAEAQASAQTQKRRAVLPCPRVFALLMMILLFTVACTVFIYSITPYLQDIGYTANFAAGCTSAAMAVLAGGKLLQGFLLDKCGLKKCTYLAFGFTIIGLLCLIFFVSPFMIAPVLLGVFFGCPYGTVAIPIIAESEGDQMDTGAAIGVFTAVSNLGSAISPFLSGIVFDATHSYVPLFTASVLVIGSCMLFVKRLLHSR